MEQPEDQLDLVRAEVKEAIGGNDAGEVVVVGDDDDGGDGEIDDGLHYLNWKVK